MNKKRGSAETLSDRLQRLLDDYGVSPERLSPICNVSNVQIRAIASGTAPKPHRSTVEKIAKGLGTTADYLINGEGEPLPNGKRDLFDSTAVAESPWKDEAWTMAKVQIREKDDTIRLLSQSFDRLTKMMEGAGPFLYPVKETA